MKYFVVFLILVLSTSTFAQVSEPVQKVSGTIINDNTKFPIANASVINVNKVAGTTTDSKGNFELEVRLSDTIHISSLSFQSLKVRVTNDWIKNKTTTIQLTEKAIALEEVIIGKYYLTGYLEVDSKLIPIKEDFRYGIPGAGGYEAGQYSAGAFGKVLGSIFNPADVLYNFFGKNPKQLKRLKEMKKDDTVRNVLETKFDRETIAVLLGIDRKEIAEILQRCSYSEAFIQTANDLQIMDAISGCYEEYKILKKK